ncbi:hypothetical protein ACFO5R_07395 [Halosolutus amylolyticus]|uniref:Uncharacterized protein n=2 Tax=Halosolutus amylolyticus TaxID=2932267 RepID=A0ABD5PMK4_9EURY|nr:hypothetical protein [Halosolutus amylolyticus]
MSTVVWAGILLFETLLLLTYVSARNAQLGLFHVYPFVWLNLSGWVLWHTSVPSGSDRQKFVAGAIAVGYFALLGYFGGLYDLFPLAGHPEAHAPHLLGLDYTIVMPPGYGPALFYTTHLVQLALSPYLLVGYVTLAYLVYVTVLDASNAAASGILGLFACISCSWPILASLVGGSGATGALATTVYAQAYALSTIAFAVTVALLYWRPFE